MDNNIAYGSIGMLSLLLVFGGTLYLSQSQLDNAYVCSTTQQVYVFDHLSSTMKTGYWIENGLSKSVTCRNGIFTKVNFIKEEPIGKKYICNQINCTEVK
jgi:hypothetical protein